MSSRKINYENDLDKEFRAAEKFLSMTNEDVIRKVNIKKQVNKNDIITEEAKMSSDKPRGCEG